MSLDLAEHPSNVDFAKVKLFLNLHVLLWSSVEGRQAEFPDLNLSLMLTQWLVLKYHHLNINFGYLPKAQSVHKEKYVSGLKLWKDLGLKEN